MRKPGLWGRQNIKITLGNRLSNDNATLTENGRN